MQDAATAPRPLDAIMLAVGDGHWLYVEEVGRRGGIPAVFLHGGPGSGAQHSHRTLFDAERFHAILFDQRGAGRSHPYLSRHANTTAHLVDDLETIRNHFGFENWIVVGGSWGSTLALAYAETYPERVAGLVLRAIFLGTDQEVEWAFVDGPSRFRPELFQAFRSALPVEEQVDCLPAYLKRLTHADPIIYAPAAAVWNTYERALSEISPGDVRLPTLADQPSRVAPTPIIEAHYIQHSFFLDHETLLNRAYRLAKIPGVIVQGRYDLLCPPAAAYALAKAWPAARLEILDAAGHAITEPGVAAAIRQGINDVADKGAKPR